jgi:hypothetical protein
VRQPDDADWPGSLAEVEREAMSDWLDERELVEDVDQRSSLSDLNAEIDAPKENRRWTTS